LTSQAKRKISLIHSFPVELEEERSGVGICSGQILTYTKIVTRVTPLLEPLETDDKTYQ